MTQPAGQARLLALFAVLVIGLLVTGWQPYERGTWLLEVFPVFIVMPMLWATRQRFPLTPLLTVLVGLHGLVLMVGGAYTYARVPFGFTLQDLLHLARNPYDRIGHFMQGFVPAIAAREVLARGAYIRGRRMANFLVLCVVLAVSATYELIEWLTAVLLGAGATDFLGTQGDPWDTQWDMFMALVGSACALLGLSRWHDRQLAAIPVASVALPFQR